MSYNNLMKNKCNMCKLCITSKEVILVCNFAHRFKVCIVFIGQYLDHYNAKPGVTFPGNADNIILAVQTPNICAKQCTETDKCKSFDYCSDTKTCRLKNTHELDVPSTVFQAAPDCNHYSRA